MQVNTDEVLKTVTIGKDRSIVVIPEWTIQDGCPRCKAVHVWQFNFPRELIFKTFFCDDCGYEWKPVKILQRPVQTKNNK